MADVPIDGQVIVLTAAKASVPPARLPDLLERTTAHLSPQVERYRREYEQIYEDEHREAFLVEWGHWDEVGVTLELGDREASAVRRAHEEQLLRIGRKRDREAEFETALEIREAVFFPIVEATDASR
ncbi:hypothetical protein [Natrarchaeobaculum sulfurireducens]|uniref:DUF8048 domain-containing protein n=1 Tax=Natrarchaeobaculum sulfurireducens TaxID=2044521 RepID=A0A346PI56_9EURY|nr:hypothetical protein [Natrarchaeobaculum sulfurireducens]AXR79201.1 hypothetical protein AArc1_2892 [Natrarchaeobaculum sulfurireducens]